LLGEKTKEMRQPRIELGSTAWEATMLTITPSTHSEEKMRQPRIELGSTAWEATMLTITPTTPFDS
jgi:hypothetical protein